MLLFAQSAFGQDYHPVPDGAKAAEAAAQAEKEEKEYRLKDRPDRFTYGKRHETSVTTESTNNTIQKTKHGTSDATVPTGVFKESFIDVGLTSAHAPSPSPNATPKKQLNPVRDASTSVHSSASSQPSPSPAAIAAPALTAPARLDITLGVSPAPNATAAPKPQ
jgi:hypothetical protein